MTGLLKEEICEIVELSDEDAEYHLRILQAGKLVTRRKDGVYELTKRAVELLNMIGITKEKVLEIAKQIDKEAK